ncbi:sugar-binding domain-containing protein [Lapillicoccus sp.]|uniref:sugar-binding transcriptional regulator n=1 Tax=Lapillicoccus sp. TaxID=1909287 RepID=UPI003264A178
MTDLPNAPFAGPREMVTAATAARMYYFGRRSKVQIAEDLGLTRFKVARLLELGRASGLVRLTVVGAGSIDLDLSERLRTRLGLRHAVVVNTTQGDDAQTRDQLGKVAADLLTEICTAEDVLGIGWARVVLAMAAKVRGLHAARVVQLTGALTRPDVEPSSVDVVRSIARDARAPSSVFYAPMIVNDEQTARGLYRQDAIAEAVARYDTVTKAVVGVGGWKPPGSTLHDALTPGEQALMGETGVQADLSGVLLDAQGEAIETPLSNRIIAINPAQLRRVAEVIGIAYGLAKVPAALAGIRGGYLTSLVTPADFATRLLSVAEEP